MVGRDVQLTVDRGESTPADVMLKAEDLSVADDRGHEVVHGVSFEVRAGEIFGIAGVAGNGQDELVEAIMGLRRKASGRVTLGDEDVTSASPRDLHEQRRRVRARRSASVRPRPVLPDHRQRRPQRLPRTRRSPAASCATTTRSAPARRSA